MKINASIMLILISVVGGGFRQVLLKKGMLNIGPLFTSSTKKNSIAFKVAANPFVVADLAVYAFSTCLWLVTLSRINLSFAYPFVSLSYIIMVIASWLLFHKDISMLRLVVLSARSSFRKVEPVSLRTYKRLK